MKKLFGAFLLCFVVSCASQKKGPPRLEEALEMRGQSLAMIKKAFGNPADEQGKRKFWFLSKESTYHPEPKARLYEFIFVDERLVNLIEQR